MKRFIYIGIALLMGVACSKESDLISRDDVSFSGEVSLCSSITTRVAGTQWESGDKIGVYMCDDATPLLSNYAYRAVSDGSTTMFDHVSSNEILYYPSSKKADFVAYYPYRETFESDGVYKIETSDQSDQEAIDLLYSNNLENIAKTATAQELKFDHVMSKVTVTLKAGEGFFPERFAGAVVTLGGVSLSGECALLNSGSITTTSERSTVRLKQSSVGGDFNDTAEAIVIPQSRIGAQVTLTLASGLSFTADIPYTNSSQYFSKGTNYLYTLEVNDSKAEIISSSIVDWITGSDYNESGTASVYKLYTLDELSQMSSHTEILSNSFGITDASVTASQMAMLQSLFAGSGRPFEIEFINAESFPAMGAASGTNSVRTISAPCALSVGDRAFDGFVAIERLSLPLVTYIGSGAFVSDKLTKVSVATGITEKESGLTVGVDPMPAQQASHAVEFRTNGLSSSKISYDSSTLYAQWRDKNGTLITSFFDEEGCADIMISAPYVYEFVPNRKRYLDPKCTVSGTTTLEFEDVEVLDGDADNMVELCSDLVGNEVAFTFPNLTTIHRYNFMGLTTLTSFSAPLATGVWGSSFENCTSLRSLYVPSATTFAEGALRNCVSLEELTHGTVNTLEDEAFRNCAKLERLDLPNVMTAPAYVFSGCTALNYVALGANCGTSRLVVDATAFANSEEAYDGEIRGTLDCSKITLYTNTNNGCSVSADLKTLYAPTTAEDLETLSMVATFKEILLSNVYTLDNFPDNFNNFGASSLTIYISDEDESGGTMKELADAVKVSKDKVFYVYMPNFRSMISQSYFENTNNIKLFNAPNLESIPTYALRLQVGLEEFYLPKLTVVPEQALSYSYNLRKLTLGKVTEIGIYGFERLLSLKADGINVEFDFDKLTTISKGAFKNTSTALSALVDFSKITAIGDQAFFTDLDPTTIPELMYESEIGHAGDVVAPECLSIGTQAFGGSKITSFTAAKCKTAGELAFNGCKELVRVKAGFESCASYLFEGCTALEEVEFTSSSIPTFGSGVFKGVTNLKRLIFSGVSELTKERVELIEKLSTPAGRAEYGLSEGIEVSFPNIISIADSAFENYNGSYFLDTETRFAKIESIGDYAFQNSCFKSMICPSAKSLSRYAFFGCQKITSLSLPVFEKMGEDGLYLYLSACTELSMPALKSLRGTSGEQSGLCFATYMLNNLKKINFASATDLDFYNNSYSSYGYFSSATNLEELDISSMVQIPEKCCYNAILLKTVHLAGANDSVDVDSTADFTVGAKAFYDCYKLTTIDAPYLKSVNSSGFYYCEGLENVELPALINLNEYAFYGCNQLTTFTAKALTTVGSRAFMNCYKLKDFAFDSVVNIYSNAFYECESLVSIVAPNLNRVDMYAFSKCSALTKIEMPVLESVDSLVFDQSHANISTMEVATDSSCTPNSWAYNTFSGLSFTSSSVIKYSENCANLYYNGSMSTLYFTGSTGYSSSTGLTAPTSCFQDVSDK